MRYPFSEREIKRREFILWLSKIMDWESRGAFWSSYFEGFLNWKQLKDLLLGGGMVKLLFPSLPLWKIMVIGAIFFIGGGLITKFLKILLGRWDSRKGIREIQGEYHAKTRFVNPFNVELRDTIKGICKRLGISHHFKDIEDKKTPKGEEK